MFYFLQYDRRRCCVGGSSDGVLFINCGVGIIIIVILICLRHD